MQLKTLLAQVKPLQVSGPVDREITSISYDSRRVKKDGLFIALRGENTDGSAFVEQAISQGAVAVVSGQAGQDSRATMVAVENPRTAMADIAAAYFQHPSTHLKMTGVTGTNGKTTVTYLLKHILEKATMRCGLLGTVRYEIGERHLPATRTTPESLDVQDLLFQIRSAGCNATVMEVSSHALAQDRVRGVEFDVAVFTNLTQDHLDYHKTMEGYFEAKSRLFTGLAAQLKKKGKAVVNIDDGYGARLLEKIPKETAVLTYGMGVRADFRASAMKIDFSGTSYQLDVRGKSYLVRLPLIGRFNVYNSLAAIAAASALGVEVRAAVQALATAPHVPGRLEAVSVKRQYRVFVDYAHTDDALLNVINTLRELSPNRLILVFGCGGSRDRAKRPLMGAVAERYADYSVITSDNPRKEDPQAIVDEIKTGFVGKNYEAILDRREAIFKAISMAQPRDIILIAGKGHEKYQEFSDHTVPFDDVDSARQAVEANPVAMQE
ncbi:MAG: UDP-N-acetylmuramoyl-L-alanyl-D-glutamate--2,6-diaminopimelate ligase [Verrucomicrobiota bacterium]